jgi:hypothetical protein
MKTFINNIPIETGEITVLMHEHAETITHHACQTAQVIRQHDLGVLVINCATSKRRFERTADCYITKESRNKRPHLYTVTMERGNLANEKGYIEDMIDGAGVNVIIISGWEWTSSSWRRKERLLYLLREWTERKNVAIVIYSQSRTEPTAGIYDRGGIGKLAMIAFAIQRIDAVEQTRNIPKPPPLVFNEEDKAAAERGAQLLVDNLTSYGESQRAANERSATILPARYENAGGTPALRSKTAD